MGWMTHRFTIRAAAQPVPKLRNEPKGSNPGVPKTAQMAHRLARDGLPLNPYQKLRNEPKASNPCVPQAKKERDDRSGRAIDNHRVQAHISIR